MKSFIILKSQTAAMKAVTVLRNMRIHAEPIRKTGKNGCVFGIIVNSDPDRVCRMLSLKGISCLSIEGEGE